AAATSSYPKLFVIDIAAPHHLIDTGHQIFVIVTRVMILNHVTEILSVGSAAARVWIQHNVTLRRHPLKLVFENVAVGGVRTPVNVQDQRVFFGGIKTWRFL